MNRSLAIRWTGRLKPCLSKSTYHGPRSKLIAQRTQFFSSSPVRRDQNLPPQSGPQHPQRRGNWKSWILFNLAGVTGVAIVAITLKSANPNATNDDKNSVINTKSFSPFTIISKEQVSPTAFVLSVRPEIGEGKKGSTRKLQEAWDHGLWSVEVKQPQLQIARHYTPLPPSDGNEGDLRFLVRKVDGGEMSTYLSKLRVGENVYLRGPHLGFDITKRLGDAKDIVFVAGGTGIAPALQIARKVLDTKPAETTAAEKPTVSILWANRLSVDALGRETFQSSKTSGSWWSGKPSSNPEAQKQTQEPSTPSLTHQIRTLQQNHPENFRISYFTDEEGTFIKEPDLRTAISPPSPATKRQPLLPAAWICPWHSTAALERLPNDNDVARRSGDCTCAKDAKTKKEVLPTSATGASLVCVSGADGFVAAYAGPKRWYRGGEMQGPVKGILGQIVKDEEVKGVNWLVLKL
ncbi:uncharacterized protein F4822DRAFT_396773 [Hypoxylon trugodes]|uniref:uncharacterized protein n=1 Tax=Hypoxylon trugodes TaxID=326681 RepID=UPI0021967F6D|nr:uncharacterized protein F4822DRAFT_396773 [Hypoxylon trugodes]KAI1391448.1 hypothetical protein F4822DRAFT_396773 [Hypoxylon trugodes]